MHSIIFSKRTVLGQILLLICLTLLSSRVLYAIDSGLSAGSHTVSATSRLAMTISHAALLGESLDTSRISEDIVTGTFFDSSSGVMYAWTGKGGAGRIRPAEAAGFEYCKMGTGWDADSYITGETYSFQCTDKIVLGAHYTMVYSSRWIGDGWYRPNGQLYWEDKRHGQIEDPADYDYEYWEWYNVIWYYQAPTYPLYAEAGTWTVRYYDNDVSVCQRNFTVGEIRIGGRITTSGGQPISGVVMNGLPGNPSTGSDGTYSVAVWCHWPGIGSTMTVTPTLAGFSFSPSNRSYGPVSGNQPNQDYTATPPNPTVSGYVRNAAGQGIPGVTISGLPGNPISQANGFYSTTVTYGWSGTAVPNLACYTFSPPNRPYSNVTSNQTDQNFTGTIYKYTISGYVRNNGGQGINGVVMTGLPSNPSTQADGSYSGTVDCGWSGSVTPTMLGYSFTPPNRPYSSVTSNQVGQDYTGTPPAVTIAGYVRSPSGAGIPGVTMAGFPQSTMTQADGSYSASVSNGWSGTVTPTLSGYTFNPLNRPYSNVTTNQADQNYVGAPQCQTICFTFTSNTEDFYAIQVDAATLEGGTLQQCDQIAVFDGNLCVGAATFNGSFPIALNAWKDDSQTPAVDGYVDGHQMTFKIARPTTCQPCPVGTPIYSVGNGTFGNAGYARVSSMNAACTPPCDPCFTYTSNTEDFYAIQIDQATIEGAALQECDEIGVFDGDLCVGAVPNKGTWPLALNAWKDDSQTPAVDGYVDGHQMTFKFSRAPNCESCAFSSPVYSVGNGTFGNAGYARITSMNATCQCQLTCFTFAANTEEYYPVVVSSATLDGANLLPCDEIGVFDGSLCVGASTFEGTWPVPINAWKDDPQTSAIDGFAAGHPMSFKVSRLPECAHFPGVPSYAGGTSGNFGDGLFAQVNSIAASTEKCITLNLNAGWNFCSINTDPSNPALLSLLAPIVSEVNIIKGCAAFCIPNVVCNISEWSVLESYKIHLKSQQTLNLCGAPVAPTTPIALAIGWNCLGYLPDCNISAPTALQSLGNCFDIIKGSRGFMIPNVVNSLGDLRPHEGYSIHLTCAGTLVYPDCPPLAKTVVGEAPVTGMTGKHFHVSATSDDYQAVVVEVNGALNPGDEIGLFTASGQLVGSGVYQSAPLALQAWKDDPGTEVREGWTTGDEMIVRVYRQVTGEDQPLDLVLESGSLVFGESPYTVVRIGAKAAEGQLPELSLSANYPNPFNPETNISFSLPTSGPIELAIYNVLGQRVKVLTSGEYPAGEHRVTWDGTVEGGQQATSGAYFYRLTTPAATSTRKMILLK